MINHDRITELKEVGALVGLVLFAVALLAVPLYLYSPTTTKALLGCEWVCHPLSEVGNQEDVLTGCNPYGSLYQCMPRPPGSAAYLQAKIERDAYQLALRNKPISPEMLALQQAVATGILGLVAGLAIVNGLAYMARRAT